MRVALLSLLALAVVGCSIEQQATDVAPSPAQTSGATSQVQTESKPVQATAAHTQDAIAAELALRSMDVPIYADAKVDSTQHSSTDPQATNAVFQTSASVKQVEYFYNSYPELKAQTANGTTVFSGKLKGIAVVIEIRANKSGTEIIAQGGPEP